MTSPTLFCDNCEAANQSRALYCRACGHPLQPIIYNITTGRVLANNLLKQRYRIIASVGKGGMGTIYRAEDTKLGNRQVALKEMSQSGLNQEELKEAADAFEQEAIMLARLNHPNLPSIFDHFEENRRWYLVMTFIEGETLEEYLSRTQVGKLPLDEVVEIAIQMSLVLGYLHNQQPAIIFRDLKPANIMRTTDGHIYLIDFGIARHFKPGQAKDTASIGSLGYAPPEQYGKAQTTPRSDIYSLGATLHQLLSGYDPSFSPFRFLPLQSLVPDVPTGLAAFIAQMVEMDQEKRPANALLVKQALQTLAFPDAVAPAPPAKLKLGSSAGASTQPANASVPQDHKKSVLAPLQQPGTLRRKRITSRSSEKAQVIYMSSVDDLSAVREQLEKTPAQAITLVFPSETQLRSRVAWKLLHARARELGKNILIVSADAGIRSVATAVHFRVAASLDFF